MSINLPSSVFEVQKYLNLIQFKFIPRFVDSKSIQIQFLLKLQFKFNSNPIQIQFKFKLKPIKIQIKTNSNSNSNSNAFHLKMDDVAFVLNSLVNF